MYELLISQLTDVFRIGLIVALVVTMHRTSAVTGRLIPLVAGVVFVAVILPTTMPSASANLTDAVMVGVVSNLIILAVVWIVTVVVKRFRP
jgi:hypothetical protein